MNKVAEMNKMRLHTLLEAWLELREASEELEEMLNVLADKDLSRLSNEAILFSASLRFCKRFCFSSWSLSRSVIFFLAISAALLRSFSSLWISWWIPAISWSGLFFGQILRSSRRSCSFSWKRRRRSLSDSTSPGSILSSNSDNRRCICCTSFRLASYSNLSFAISANLAPSGTNCNKNK